MKWWGRKEGVESRRGVVVLYIFLISLSSCVKKCRKEESEHVDLSKRLRHLGVLVGHKREVASYRDRRQATGP